MGWLKRRNDKSDKTEQPSAPNSNYLSPVRLESSQELAVAEWSASGLIYLMPNGDIQVKASNVAEAKRILKDLRLHKKRITAQKKIATQEMATIRTRYRIKNANRGPAVRGGGKFGKVVRSLDSINRSADRSNKEKDLLPFENQKIQYDQALNSIDELIQKIESYILQQSSE